MIGEIPGSVYSALLENGVMEDPFYRNNEAKALAVMDEEFVFTKEFDYKKKSSSILLVCEGIDTLCDLYINGHFIAHDFYGTVYKKRLRYQQFDGQYQSEQYQAEKPRGGNAFDFDWKGRNGVQGFIGRKRLVDSRGVKGVNG